MGIRDERGGPWPLHLQNYVVFSGLHEKVMHLGKGL